MEIQDYFIDKHQQFNKDYDLGDLNLSSYYSGRTKFQLEHFVQNEHDCPERKFLQLMMELKCLRDGFIIDSLEIEKTKLQIEQLLSTQNPIDKIEALKKQYSLGLLNESMTLRKREVKDICELLKKLPKIYTYEEIQAAEKTYWEKRLTRQCAEEMVSRTTGINPGNIRSLIQADCALGEKFLELQNMIIQDFKTAQVLQLQ
jgi:hypothetical protein